MERLQEKVCAGCGEKFFAPVFDEKVQTVFVCPSCGTENEFDE